jgi:hypothetical protein
MAAVQVHKIELFVVDHDGLGGEEVRDVLENARYPNRCIYPRVLSVDTRDIVWSDSHPLNRTSTADAEVERLFRKPR